jgi:drug/metabolite transporter (DMT)-like permease
MNIPALSYQQRVFIAFAAVYLIWGSTYLAIRFSIETLPPLLSSGLRFFLAGCILYTVARFKQQEPRPEKIHWKSAVIIGACLILGGNGNVVLAERFVSSSMAALVVATTPLWMVLLQWLGYKQQRPSVGVFIGLAIGFLGVGLLMIPPAGLHEHAVHVGGAALLIVAAISWAFGSVYSRQAPLPPSPMLATGMQMLSGGALLFLLGFLRGEALLIHWAAFSLKSILAFFYLLGAGSLIGFRAYIWLLKHVGIAKTSTYAFVNPVVAVFLGCMLAGEQLSAQMMIAACLVITAVVVITLHHNE